MSIECSTSSSTLPPPVAPPPAPPTASSASSAPSDGKAEAGGSGSEVGGWRLEVGGGGSITGRRDVRPTTHDPRPTRRRPAGADRQTFWFWLMAGPAVLGFLVFSLGPMLASGYLSFTSYDVVNPPKFIGAGNYVYLMT